MYDIKFDEKFNNVVVLKDVSRIYPQQSVKQNNFDEHERNFRDQVNWFYGQFARNGNCWV